jgi:hypothetical protein
VQVQASCQACPVQDELRAMLWDVAQVEALVSGRTPDTEDVRHCPAGKGAVRPADSMEVDSRDRVVAVVGSKEGDIPDNSRDSSRLSSKDCRNSSCRHRRWF